MNHIREWTVTDARDLAMAINNEKVQDNLRDGIPFPYTEKDAEDYIRHVLGAPAGSAYFWAIHDNKRAIGSISVMRKDNIHGRTGEMGYYIAEPCWGKGIMTNAVREACDYVFMNTDIVRIFAEPFSHNAASCRVLEKAGFQKLTVLNKAAIKNGQIINLHYYELLAP